MNNNSIWGPPLRGKKTPFEGFRPGEEWQFKWGDYHRWSIISTELPAWEFNGYYRFRPDSGVYKAIQSQQLSRWTRWHGDVCPVTSETPLVVLFRNLQETYVEDPQCLDWRIFDEDSDIIGYRRAANIDKGIDDLAIENAKLRKSLADIANNFNVVGSDYDRAINAMEDMVRNIKKNAREALV